mgnify:CR=1 FL=1
MTFGPPPGFSGIPGTQGPYVVTPSGDLSPFINGFTPSGDAIPFAANSQGDAIPFEWSSFDAAGNPNAITYDASGNPSHHYLPAPPNLLAMAEEWETLRRSRAASGSIQSSPTSAQILLLL